jgi:hypothetical protein
MNIPIPIPVTHKYVFIDRKNLSIIYISNILQIFPSLEKRGQGRFKKKGFPMRKLLSASGYRMRSGMTQEDGFIRP